MRTLLTATGVIVLVASVVGGIGLYCQLGAKQPKDGKKDEDEITNSVDMVFVRIPKGKFLMGSPQSEAQRMPDEFQHEVAITRPFWLGAYEVTQRQYELVMGTNPSYFSATGGGKARFARKDTSEYPVERVSWNDALAFCKKLSTKEKKTYRLPTEAEWEYACRAGSTTPFHSGKTFTSVLANINGLKYASYGTAEAGPFHRNPVPIGEYKPNAFNLCDMHGNVQEWCADWHGLEYYKISPKGDPQGPDKGTERVVRGGAWASSAKTCRSAARHRLAPDERNYSTGFRVVMEIK
ncbi:MAG: formylglycine-generating enzyme family protein [Planctomycetes bacterium]|nr:formylglycine-generating enzyme family protein [Planctomycetota bacterium]